MLLRHSALCSLSIRANGFMIQLPCYPPSPVQISVYPTASLVNIAAPELGTTGKRRQKRGSVKLPKPCSLYLSYSKNCAVVHKAIKMLPQPPFHWGIVTDIRHKFYRIQIPFCVASCLNCTLECLLTAAFFLTCCCRQTVASPFFPCCSTFHRLFKYWPPPCPPQLF